MGQSNKRQRYAGCNKTLNNLEPKFMERIIVKPDIDDPLFSVQSKKTHR